MYCPNCGNELPEYAKFCNNCGSPIDLTGRQLDLKEENKPIPIQPVNPTPDPVKRDGSQPLVSASVEELSEMYPQYKSLGGWLLLFYIGQIIGILANIGGALGIAAIVNNLLYFSEAAKTFMGFTVFSAIAGVAFNIMHIVNIQKRKNSFLRIFEIFSIINVILALVILGMDHSKVATFISAVLSTIIWNMYFRKSVRVKVYMGSDEFLRNSLFGK